jgi:hypothetical protein
MFATMGHLPQCRQTNNCICPPSPRLKPVGFHRAAVLVATLRHCLLSSEQPDFPVATVGETLNPQNSGEAMHG